MDADWYGFLNEVVRYSDAILSPIGEFPPPVLEFGYGLYLSFP
jgi:hypothetical protein